MLMKHTQVARDGTVTEPVSSFPRGLNHPDLLAASTTHVRCPPIRTNLNGRRLGQHSQEGTHYRDSIRSHQASIQQWEGQGMFAISVASSAYKAGRDTDPRLSNPSETFNGELDRIHLAEPMTDVQPLVAQSIAMGFTSMRLKAMYEVSRKPQDSAPWLTCRI